MDLELLKSVSSYAEVAAIDWATLDQRGQGLVASDEYVRLLTLKRIEFGKLLDTLVITNDEYGPGTSAEYAATAWNSIYEEFSRFGDTYLAGLQRGQVSVAWEAALRLNASVIRTLVIIINAVCSDSETFHGSGMARQVVQSGVITLAEAQADAGNCYSLWDATLLLDRWGMLDGLKKEGAVHGLGIWQRALIYALAALGGIAIVSYAIYTAYALSVTERTEWAKRDCYDAAGNVKQPMSAPCAIYFDNLATGAFSKDFTAVLDQIGKAVSKVGTGIAWAIGLGTLAYVVGVHVLPELLREVRSPARSS